MKIAVKKCMSFPKKCIIYLYRKKGKKIVPGNCENYAAKK